MKKRVEFVSNSSSTSFVCQVCGREEGGMGMGYDDAGMKGCVHGHTVCESEFGKPPKGEELAELILECLSLYPGSEGRRQEYLELKGTMANNEWVEHVIEKESNWVFDDDGEMPAALCPICQFEKMIPEDIARYLMIKSGTSKEVVTIEVSERFKDYESFRKYIRADH